ncbi:MAG: BMP family ABC transporter substrate-binding protein [Clostridiales bacterium]|nr:BMP family ABC transporter substrate-binding protein [Clostridiales bacterium]
MKKRLLALLLACLMMFTLAACTGDDTPPSEDPEDTAAVEPDDTLTKDTIKIGMVMIGEENDNGYNYNHVVGMEEMQEALGISDEQIIYKTNIPEDSQCETAIRELVEAGCSIIFANSFGHEQYMVLVAEEHPEVEFCHATGYQSAVDEMENTHNYFTKIFEARYLAGIAAGLKAKEVENSKLGYVAAKPFAEVISGYTAFYLGAKSVYPEVTMDVIYTNEWSDAALEAQAAQALIDGGCGVISQHSDTTAPATTAAQNGVFQVGYNADMIPAAPDASLVSARIDWDVYYTYAVQCMLDGTPIPQDWCQGLAEDAVYLSPLNEDIIAEGTAEAIEAAKAELIDGTRHVFAGPFTGTGDNFGETVTIDLKEGVWFEENETASAPSFLYIIEGVNVLQ